MQGAGSPAFVDSISFGLIHQVQILAFGPGNLWTSQEGPKVWSMKVQRNEFGFSSADRSVYRSVTNTCAKITTHIDLPRQRLVLSTLPTSGSEAHSCL